MAVTFSSRMFYKVVQNLSKSSTGCQVFNPNFVQKREFLKWLVKMWNIKDMERVEMLGPDRVCAEWILRNSGGVKFKGEKDWCATFDYFPDFKDTSQPPPPFHKKIEEVDCHKSSVSGYGFLHFEGCKHIKKMRFHSCHYIMDLGLDRLKLVKDSLQHLELHKCSNITDQGLRHLVDLSNLNVLVIKDLEDVENKEETGEFLRNGLKHCEINYEP